MAGSRKITKALGKRITQAKGAPVTAVVFAAIDTEKLTLSSFAARAQQRNATVRAQLERVMARVQAWEQQSGTSVPVTFRPEEAAVTITAPADLLEQLAAEDAVAALDVDQAAA